MLSGLEAKFTIFPVPRENILASVSLGIVLNIAVDAESAVLVGAGIAGFRRFCFAHTQKLVITEKRGRTSPTIKLQSVTDLLISMKLREETTRYSTWKACHYLDTFRETEMACQAKVYGSVNPI